MKPTSPWRAAAWLPVALSLALAVVGAAPPASSKTPGTKTRGAALVPGARGGPTDFTGVWELDPKASSGGSPNMDKAVLEVTQRKNRIWIQPVEKTRETVIAEEVIVDGQPYEKALGHKNRGTLTAKWGTDAKSLWLEVVAGPEDNPRAAVQRSVWRLSEDRNVWVRETVTLQRGSTKQARLVFRRQAKK
ncbi:MAG: hypothetical protein ABI592_13695 [Acidobacteriota bacterium]